MLLKYIIVILNEMQLWFKLKITFISNYVNFDLNDYLSRHLIAC